MKNYACLYHWVGYGDCTQVLKNAHTTLDHPNQVFEYKIIDVFAKIMARARTANPQFQLFVSTFASGMTITLKCDSISWAPWYREYAFLTTTLRKDMNSIVDKLNSLLKRAAEALNVGLGGGIFYVDGFQEKFNGWNTVFCEQEDEPS